MAEKEFKKILGFGEKTIVMGNARLPDVESAPAPVFSRQTIEERIGVRLVESQYDTAPINLVGVYGEWDWRSNRATIKLDGSHIKIWADERNTTFTQDKMVITETGPIQMHGRQEMCREIRTHTFGVDCYAYAAKREPFKKE